MDTYAVAIQDEALLDVVVTGQTCYIEFYQADDVDHAFEQAENAHADTKSTILAVAKCPACEGLLSLIY